MRKKLMDWIFREELIQLNKNHQREKEKILDTYKLEIEDMKALYEIPKRIFNLFPDSEILGIEKNKNEEEVYVFRTVSESGLNIYLCGRSYKAINMLPRIMATLKHDNSLDTNYLKINDIQMVDNDIGNGSIAMKYFIQSSKKINTTYISGGISSVDSDHFDRLEHYYKKFGFKVAFDKERTSGSIKLNLEVVAN